MRLVRTNHKHHDFKQLVELLDGELAIRDGDDHEFYHQFNGIIQLDHVVVAYINQKAVGCGAFKVRTQKQIEIKRMFTVEKARNKGVAYAILNELEAWAISSGYQEAILETGKAQIEALRFYPKMHYQITENFPPYVNVANSICFCKKLR